MAITLRGNKGSALTHAELDANFTDFMVLSGAGASRTLTGLYVADTSATLSIGTTSTTYKVDIQGSSGQLFSIADTFTGTIFSVNDVSGIPSIEVLDTGLIKLAEYDGSVVISTSTAQTSQVLTVQGSTYIKSLGVGTVASGTTGEIRAAHEITAYYSSDEKLKENVTLILDPIEKLKQIRGVNFDWTDDYLSQRGGEDGYFVRKRDIGVIAQEVEKVLPEIVGTRDDGYKAVKYEKLTALLIEAIKEQQSQIDKLVVEIELLKNEK